MSEKEKELSLVEILSYIKDNPDDLSMIPKAIEHANNMLQTEQDNQLRISKLQDSNRAYLAQIPVASTEPPKQTEPQEPTMDEFQEALTNLF